MAVPAKRAKRHFQFDLAESIAKVHSWMHIDYFRACKLPQVIFQHQLYSLPSSTRTIVDRAVESESQSGFIISIPLGGSNNDKVIVLKTDYINHIESKYDVLSVKDKALLSKFVENVLKPSNASSFQKESLHVLGIEVDDISRLVRLGYISNINESTSTLSLPGLGVFTRDMSNGREALLKSLKRKKFKEVLESELMKKKLKAMRLSVEYHISDLAGLDAVDVIETSSGRLLRLKPEQKSRRK
eukprot:TRINITY_DN9841_c0_g1_i2.p2 TRINITY_DN9841_c0_g1~~TRINITY_DN9841_c0_g1_i2.p2  ORF type:complete len:243 (+),score=36.08 TRINITY_DN9841_c0_g1_i2:1476-2204(+)